MLAKRRANSSRRAAMGALRIFDALVESDPTNQEYRDLQRQAQVAVGRARPNQAVVNVRLDRF
jgi:hypothetical protein